MSATAARRPPRRPRSIDAREAMSGTTVSAASARASSARRWACARTRARIRDVAASSGVRRSVGVRLEASPKTHIPRHEIDHVVAIIDRPPIVRRRRRRVRCPARRSGAAAAIAAIARNWSPRIVPSCLPITSAASRADRPAKKRSAMASRCSSVSVASAAATSSSSWRATVTSSGPASAPGWSTGRRRGRRGRAASGRDR